LCQAKTKPKTSQRKKIEWNREL